ncbi:MAG: hypothetical protein AAGD38_14855, partial [Acidobacteriota bacterium]
GPCRPLFLFCLDLGGPPWGPPPHTTTRVVSSEEAPAASGETTPTASSEATPVASDKAVPTASGEAAPAASEEAASTESSRTVRDTTAEVEAASREREREQLLPKLDVYFPEGRLDLRLSRMIKNAFFEGQVQYDFVDGDISAFLRYRYYGANRVYQLTVFDAVEFENLEDLDNDFERTRGGLFLIQWPHDYSHRTFLLTEIDQFSSSKEEFQFVNDTTNTFVRAGFQRGTPNDSRSNAIVGETRARVENLFTSFRKIGPRGFGFTTALTYSFDFLGADFHYAKLEFEMLKRFELPGRLFAVARAGGGTFVYKEEVFDDPDVPDDDRFSIPRTELLRVGGRERLKGVDFSERGTEALLGSVEVFVPWFENETRRALGLDWENFYWIGYAGVGTVGFDTEVYTDWDQYFPDVGIGFEASFRLKEFEIFVNGIVAESLQNSTGLETSFSLKSYH